MLFFYKFVMPMRRKEKKYKLLQDTHLEKCHWLSSSIDRIK